MKNFLVIAVLVFCFVSCTNSNKTDLLKTKAEKQVEEEVKILSLQDKLDAFANKSKEKLPEELKAVMIAALEKLKNMQLERKFLKVGDKAPNFKLKDVAGNKYELDKLVKESKVVITFFRGGWCPYCSLELRAYQEKLGAIEANGAKFFAISPEIPAYSVRTSNKHSLSFPLLYDKDNDLAKDFNLVFELDDSLKPIYKSFGIDLVSFNGNKDWELPVPATYIIGEKRKILYAFADVDYKKRAEPEEVINILKRFAAETSQ